MVEFPDSIVAGETLKACIVIVDATAVQAFVVGPARHEVAFAPSDSSRWLTATDTAEWVPGLYRFEVWATLADNSRMIAGRGTLLVGASLESAPGGEDYDPRTRAQRMVEKIEAMLEGNASAGVRRYRINNRELERYTLSELMDLLAYWKRQAAIEARKNAGTSVLGPRIEFTL